MVDNPGFRVTRYCDAIDLLKNNLSQPVASVIIGCEQMVPLEQSRPVAVSVAEFFAVA